MSCSDTPDPEDDRFRAVFLRAALPCPPCGLARRVQGRLRRRRFRIAAVAVVAAVLIVGLSIFLNRPEPPTPGPAPEVRAEVFPFAPPVDSLEVLTLDLDALDKELKR